MTKFVNRRRWSDVNNHWGIFTYCPGASSSFKSLFVSLRSASGETKRDPHTHEYDGCHLILGFRGHTLIIELPDLIKPYQQKRYPDWDAVTVERLGRNWYIDYHMKDYGFSSDGSSVILRYGVQTHNSSTSKSKVLFYPWKEMRHIRSSYYNADGSLVGDVLRYSKTKPLTGIAFYDECNKLESSAEKADFKVRDSDGTLVNVTAYISEEEYAHGTGYFKWLSWFMKPTINRTMTMRFDKEVGSEKGSWKGGLTGSSVSIQVGEQPEAAFKRYIEDVKNRSDKHRVTLAYMGMEAA